MDLAASPATALFFLAWIACALAFVYALAQLVVFVRRARDRSAGPELALELLDRRRRIGRAVLIFFVSWLVGWGLPVLAPGLLGLD